MTTPTPGRRLHAALLAHGILVDDWDDLSPTWWRDLDAAARDFDGGRDGVYRTTGPSKADVDGFAAWLAKEAARVVKIAVEVQAKPLFARLGALEAAVAALRRDRDADRARIEDIGENTAADCDRAFDRLNASDRDRADDLAAFAEVGNRLARCEGRDGEVIERLTKLERAEQVHERAIEHRSAAGMRRLNDHESRLAALEAAIRTPPDETQDAHMGYWVNELGKDVIRLAERLAALEARAIDGGDPLRRNP